LSLLIHRRSGKLAFRDWRLRDDTVFAARHLPLARATSFESWSDLSGAPYLRAGFFVRTGHARLAMEPPVPGC
jgi:hypothetical protein